MLTVVSCTVIPGFTSQCAHTCTAYPITRVLLQTGSVNLRARGPQCFLYTAAVQKDILLPWVAVVVTEHLGYTDKNKSQCSDLGENFTSCKLQLRKWPCLTHQWSSSDTFEVVEETFGVVDGGTKNRVRFRPLTVQILTVEIAAIPKRSNRMRTKMTLHLAWWL